MLIFNLNSKKFSAGGRGSLAASFSCSSSVRVPSVAAAAALDFGSEGMAANGYAACAAAASALRASATTPSSR